jgi:hypothetical protein
MRLLEMAVGAHSRGAESWFGKFRWDALAATATPTAPTTCAAAAGRPAIAGWVPEEKFSVSPVNVSEVGAAAGIPARFGVRVKLRMEGCGRAYTADYAAFPAFLFAFPS